MSDAEAMAGKLCSCFAQIADQRMQGIAIVNPVIEVQVVGMQTWNGYWLCILITPWFMNIVLVPETADRKATGVGSKRIVGFPAGSFEFIESHEPVLGTFFQCSLFSPMFEFADQPSAELAAAAALGELLKQAEDATEDERGMAMIWNGELPRETEELEPGKVETAAAPQPAEHQVSRRAFLTGTAKTGGQTV